MCSIYYNLRGNIYSASCADSIIKMPGKYQYSILFNTSTSEYRFFGMVGYRIGQWWMQWHTVK